MSNENLSAIRAEAGRKGGLSSTETKAAASRANGKLGGRPRKKPQTAQAKHPLTTFGKNTKRQ